MKLHSSLDSSFSSLFRAGIVASRYPHWTLSQQPQRLADSGMAIRWLSDRGHLLRRHDMLAGVNRWAGQYTVYNLASSVGSG